MTTQAQPCFTSLALAGQLPADWADVVIVPLPEGASDDPRFWAREIFSSRSMPTVVTALMGLRQLLVPLIGVKPGTLEVFTVDHVVGDEALIVEEDRHLDFRCGVGVDRQARLLRVTTAVWLHGWRGRLYFAPVSVLHDPITRSMMRRAVRRTASRP